MILQMEHSEGTVIQIGELSQGINNLTVSTNLDFKDSNEAMLLITSYLFMFKSIAIFTDGL